MGKKVASPGAQVPFDVLVAFTASVARALKKGASMPAAFFGARSATPMDRVASEALTPVCTGVDEAFRQPAPPKPPKKELVSRVPPEEKDLPANMPAALKKSVLQKEGRKEFDLDDGNDDRLSKTLKKFSNIFDQIYLAVVTGGEFGEDLPAAFERLALYFGREQKLRGREGASNAPEAALCSLYRFFARIDMTIAGRVPILDAMALVAQELPDPYKKAVLDARQALSMGGDSFSSSLEPSKLFSGEDISEMRAGEVGGCLDRTFRERADLYAERLAINP
ncbi:MAG: type II secretion system F family protein [bacterium]|nr:type II secretion system F family protein [bacterium]